MKKRIAALTSIALALVILMTAAALPASAENTSFTPEEYAALMAVDPTFNLKAYMYYNEDLMSRYLYDYWKYYKHYLDHGRDEGRIALFPEGNPYGASTLGSYSTKYDPNVPRGTNVELACNYMNGTIVLPGGTFSYNQTVGVRSSARGFKEAPIYIAGEKATGIGGGICQVSSTTYVAMIIAGILPAERHQHSLPVSYLKPNLDATVSWGTLDLKFVNPFDFPLVIFASYDGNGVCTVTIDRYIG